MSGGAVVVSPSSRRRDDHVVGAALLQQRGVLLLPDGGDDAYLPGGQLAHRQGDQDRRVVAVGRDHHGLGVLDVRLVEHRGAGGGALDRDEAVRGGLSYGGFVAFHHDDARLVVAGLQ
jgi:hypothetical protein